MSGAPQRSNGRQERRPRKPRTMAPLLGLVRGGAKQSWLRAVAESDGAPGKPHKVWRGIKALRATDRFRLWLAFVLSPRELGRFERWAVANDAAYAALLRLYQAAAGSEDQENLLVRLHVAVGIRDDDSLGVERGSGEDVGSGDGRSHREGPEDDDGLSS